MPRLLAALALAIAACSTPPSPAARPEPTAPAAAPPAAAVAALVGTTPPAWQADRWMNSPPLELAKLRGSVVLVRWWTAGCPYCSTTAPALRKLDQTYGSRGLRVIGMYHHKEDTAFDPKVYEDTAKKYEFTFPLAFDEDWHTLRSWLRDKSGQPVDTGWTSVTFLLDKRGVVRQVHPGGSYVEGDPAYADMNATIERLLAESVQ
jgi:peroxiredoxin